MIVPQSLRLASVAAAALLTLTACGGGIGGDAPENADVGEFCEFPTDAELTAEEAAKELAEIGTPDGISEAERRGFEAYVDALNDEGDTPNAEVLNVTVSQDDEADGKAFLAYRDELCTTYFEDNPPTAEPSE